MVVDCALVFLKSPIMKSHLSVYRSCPSEVRCSAVYTMYPYYTWPWITFGVNGFPCFDIHRFSVFLLTTLATGSMTSWLSNIFSIIFVLVCRSDVVAPSISWRIRLSSSMESSFSSMALLTRPWSMAYIRLSVMLTALWPWMEMNLATAFSMKPKMPALASFSVVWLTLTVLSARHWRYSSACCSLQTMWTAKTPKEISCPEESWIASMVAGLPVWRLRAREFARVIRYRWDSPGEITGAGQQDRR